MLIVWNRIFPVFVGRYAYPGDPPPRHASNARQCAGTVLLCLLHLWNCWGAAVGWATTEPMLHGRRRQNVSCYSNRQMSLHQEAVKVPSALISLNVSAIILKKGSISTISQALPCPDQDHILCAVSRDSVTFSAALCCPPVSLLHDFLSLLTMV